MRVVPWTDGARAAARPRSASKVAGVPDEPNSACGVFSEMSFPGACPREHARVDLVEGRENLTGGNGKLDTPRQEEQVSARPIRPRAESSLQEVRQSLFGLETSNADRSSALPPSEEWRAPADGGLAHPSPRMARVVPTAATANRRPSKAAGAHAEPLRSDGAERSESLSSADPLWAAKRDGTAPANPAQASAHVARLVDGSNESGMNGRAVRESGGDEAGLDRAARREPAPAAGGHDAFVWEQGKPAAVDEHPVTVDIREVGYRAAPIEGSIHERSGGTSVGRLTVVVHSEETGDVGVRITIRGDDAHIGIVASADVARSIERDQSLLEGSIQSSTGLNTVISVTAGDELEMRGSLIGDGGGDWISHGSSFSDNEAERGRGSDQFGALGNRDQQSVTSSAIGNDVSLGVRGARIL